MKKNPLVERKAQALQEVKITSLKAPAQFRPDFTSLDESAAAAPLNETSTNENVPLPYQFVEQSRSKAKQLLKADPMKAKEEMKACRDHLEQRLGKKVPALDPLLARAEKEICERYLVREVILERLDLMLRHTNSNVDTMKRRSYCEDMYANFEKTQKPSPEKMCEALRKRFVINEETFQRNRMGLEKALQEREGIHANLGEITEGFYGTLFDEIEK